MKRLVKTLLLILVILPVNLLSQSELTNLFNSSDLENWQKLNGSAQFEIEGDKIVGISTLGTPNTFLATKEKYKNFILEYEAKIEEGLNSGVQIRSNSLDSYKDGRVHGYQVEIDPSARSWSGGIYDEARRGWLYNLECNPEAKTAFRKNAWNKFRVEAFGNNIRVWLNDVPSADIIDDRVEEGFIALQVHSINDASLEGKKVWFRNIKIKTDKLEAYLTPQENQIPQKSYLNNELSKREKAEGWKLLWDGVSNDGWRGAKIDHFPEKGWKIENGNLIVVESDGGESEFGGDIVTEKKYGDFELLIDFKYTKGANSGIKYFVDTELNMGKGSSIGCEYQILDDKHHPDAKQGTEGNRTLASLYDLISANALFYAPNEKYKKRVNEYDWNRARIVVNGKKVEHYLNGIKVLEYERATQMWRALVARSKYHVWPNFGELKRGHILLQDHGNKVYYKNIKIKEME